MAELAGYGGEVSFSSIVGSDAACANGWSLDINIDTHDVTDFCSTSAWRDFITGLKGWTASVDLKIDGAHGINATDIGTSASLTLSVDSSHAYTGTALLNSISPSVTVDAEETQTVGFQGTGALSYS